MKTACISRNSSSGNQSKIPESSILELPEFSSGKFPDLRALIITFYLSLMDSPRIPPPRSSSCPWARRRPCPLPSRRACSPSCTPGSRPPPRTRSGGSRSRESKSHTRLQKMQILVKVDFVGMKIRTKLEIGLPQGWGPPQG